MEELEYKRKLNGRENKNHRKVAAFSGLSLSLFALVSMVVMNIFYRLYFDITTLWLNFIPIVLFLALIFFIKGKKLYIILSVIFYIVSIVVIFFNYFMFELGETEITTNVKDYKKFLRIQGNYDHFPKEIPLNVTDVIFYGRTSDFLSNSGCILMYTTSNEEIEEYENRYKDKINDRIIDVNSVLASKKDIDYRVSEEENENFKTIILSDREVSFLLIGVCTESDGILINKNTNQIAFFVGISSNLRTIFRD